MSVPSASSVSTVSTAPSATASARDTLTPEMEAALFTQYEHVPTHVYSNSSEVNVAVATEIADLIKSKAAAGESCVLGLATGSTPTGVYAQLIRMHQEDHLSFKNVITFNLDEYFPMDKDALQSYVRFMNEHLFDHIDIPKQNIHIPDGTLDVNAIYQHCLDYEDQIHAAGGLDLQILGIGRTGHIGFNEPGSGKDSRTRLITLDRVTRLDAAGDFFGEENVPRRAVTMGVGTIMAAERVILIAFGEGKAAVTAQAIEGPVTPVVAASFLQEHHNATFMLDRAAADKLTRFDKPWLLGPVNWDAAQKRKAVIWLANRLEKPILKITDEDYNQAGLQDLIALHGPAEKLNVEIFRDLQRTITGWPGGKPDTQKRPGDLARKNDEIFPKRCLIFSPHPDDDVISMGGTMLRLVDHGHHVHVAYQVSGNIAVFDEDAARFADFAADFNRLFGFGAEQTEHTQQAKIAEQVEAHIDEFLRNKKPGQVDSPEIQKLKGLIRRGEARAAARYCGLTDDKIHFLDMPFYETGTVRKKPIGEGDIQIIIDLLRETKPHQIYAAGDLSDPHGTHRVCLSAILQAIDRIKKSGDAWIEKSEVWLYRGAWQEWPPEMIEMAVPIAPGELQRKRVAIFKHESQKDKALFPGSDPREFWQRAEDRNRETARTYDKLGLSEYEAIEGFVLWKGNVDYA